MSDVRRRRSGARETASRRAEPGKRKETGTRHHCFHPIEMVKRMERGRTVDEAGYQNRKCAKIANWSSAMTTALNRASHRFGLYLQEQLGLGLWSGGMFE